MNTPNCPASASAASVNDRATPRWALATIACAVLCGGQWYDVTVVDVSLGGVKVCGRWDRMLPITAVSLEDAGAPVTGDLLIVPADSVRVDQTRATAALRFDVQDRALAGRLLRFLSAHVAGLSPGP